MKSIKNLAFSALLTIGAFTAVTYTACNKDECKDVICQNGGTCVGGDCSCPAGYEGTLCETLSITKYVKSWSADETTSGSQHNVYTISIGVGTTVVDATIGNNLSNFFIGTVKATVDKNTITIPSQIPDNDGYKVDGTGTYANGKISWSYSITNTNVTPNQVVTVSGTWQ